MVLMTTRIKQPHCGPQALLWEPVQKRPGQTTSSSVPVSALPISPTSLNLTHPHL